MDWTKIFSEVWRQSPLAALLLLILLGSYHGTWVWGQTYSAMVAERDEFKGIAYRCVGVVTDTAQKVATAVEQPREAKSAVPKLTETEKESISQPTSAEPAELRQKLEETKKVLAKIEPTPVPSPGKKAND